MTQEDRKEREGIEEGNGEGGRKGDRGVETGRIEGGQRVRIGRGEGRK